MGPSGMTIALKWGKINLNRLTVSVIPACFRILAHMTYNRHRKVSALRQFQTYG